MTGYAKSWSRKRTFWPCGKILRHLYFKTLYLIFNSKKGGDKGTVLRDDLTTKLFHLRLQAQDTHA
jgi:hypothetical protein